MAAIAWGILTAPQKVWEPLTDTEKKHLAAWLGQINEYTVPDCNWHFFHILVCLALKRVQMPYSPELLEDSLTKIDSYYSGDGWSTDGNQIQKDYYIPWAIQYYGLLYSKLAGDTDPQRAALYRHRAELFTQQFVYWFDANGAALPFGRSLTYRFAQNCFWSACIWAGLEPLPLPVMKGIIVRNFRWWLSQNIFDRDGILTIGYCYPQMYMAENYNASGSPYWSMKSFLLLACRTTTPSGQPKPPRCPRWIQNCKDFDCCQRQAGLPFGKPYCPFKTLAYSKKAEAMLFFCNIASVSLYFGFSVSTTPICLFNSYTTPLCKAPFRENVPKLV